MIKITFPDGNIKEFKKGITLREIASSISSSLNKSCIVGKVNAKFYDMTMPILEDSAIELLSEKNENQYFEVLNHSAAHIMAQAVKKLFPEAKFGVGPAIEEGFYYDIDAGNMITEEDLIKIEKEMMRIAAGAFDFEYSTMSYEEAKEFFKNDEYKLYLIEKINNKGEVISVYSQGPFTDLCRGIHIDNTKRLKHFKILSIAGAYWLGDSNNIMLQRIYGTAWYSKEALDNHLIILEERKNSDHRKLGKELELFTFTKETGSGLPLWLPNGAAIRNQLERFIKVYDIVRDRLILTSSYFRTQIMKR